MLHPEKLKAFVDPLPRPPLARAVERRADPLHPGRSLDYYRIEMRAAQTQVHRDMPPTTFWGYEGAMPGPTFDVRAGTPLLIDWVNALPKAHLFPIDHTLHGAGARVPDVRAVVHVHGARVPPESDGYPEHWYEAGKSAVYRYPNSQQATTLWYHDHAMGIERLNVYAGLLGVYLLRDASEQALDLPRGEFEIPLVIFDRQFKADGSLYYPDSGLPESPWVSEAYGDVILINGKIAPFLEVEPRTYRFRVVNASNARFYYLAMSDGTRFEQIGSDQGLLGRTASMETLTLAPAERADLIVDFSGKGGQTLILRNQAMQMMQFRVSSRALSAPATPSTSAPRPMAKALPRLERLERHKAVNTRRLTLNDYEDPNTHMMMMLLNATYWRQPVTEKPLLGSVEIWEFVNLTEDTHPIHLHMVRFQIMDRQKFDVDEYLMSGTFSLVGQPVPPLANEMGWKDTVRADAGLVTRIIVPFDGYPGRFVWHCHVLEHAANEMMRPFEVVRSPPAPASKI